MIEYLLLLLGVVIVCIIENLNSGKDEEYVSDEELRESFLKEYINHDCCVLVKINSLPNSFKIGNVYFDKGVYNNKYYQAFLSYVIVEGKVYDNGTLSIDFEFSCNTTNKDLMDYILNNLDKVEEAKQ